MNPRIYVASLSDYNNGKLHGAWIDAAQAPDDIQADIDAMLAESKEDVAEEWAIHDTDDFGAVSVHEYESLAVVSSVALGLEQWGEAFGLFVAHYGTDENVTNAFQDAYSGCWRDEASFAGSLYDDGLYGECSDALAPYIDFERMARDLFIGDYFGEHGDDGLHVFRRC